MTQQLRPLRLQSYNKETRLVLQETVVSLFSAPVPVILVPTAQANNILVQKVSITTALL